MKHTTLLTCLMAAAALLAACAPQAGGVEAEGAPLQAWFDAPLDESVLPLEAYTLVFSAASFAEPIDSFEFSVNGAPQDTLPPLYQNSEGNAQYGYAEFGWLPPAPGTYVLQVRALAGGAVSPFAEVHVVVSGEAQAGDQALPLTTPAVDVLQAAPLQNVNCREGNSSQFDIADTLFANERYTPNARGFDNLWVRFFGPVNQVQCWVFTENLEILLNEQPVELADVSESLLPFAAYPATPTPLPTATFTPEPDPVPQCRDGIDNDGDGRIDFGSPAAIVGGTSDRQCASADDDDERN